MTYSGENVVLTLGLGKIYVYDERERSAAVEEYVRRMSRNNVYGDDYEMSSLMKSYGFDVDVFSLYRSRRWFPG